MNDPNVEVKPVIKNGKVIRLEVCGMEWPLKKSIPVEDLLKVTESIQTLGEYVDFSGMRSIKPALEEWQPEEIYKFLEECNEVQRTFLKLLAENGEMTKEQLVDVMKKILNKPDFRGWDLGGALAGMGIRMGRLKKEPLYYIEKRRTGGKVTHYYRINEKYRQTIRKWFESHQ
ncbi:MAG TPA: hypothetical protein ENG27_01355 [Candidatus Bathyarchaeota archaeon]|nr:hypothetical protein [Candidatus Bathyarchaeota archaeon]